MIKNKDKKITNILIGMILGIVLAGTSAYAAIIYSSDQVSYSNSTSGLTSTNVQGALDELNILCSSSSTTGIDASYIDFGSISVNANKTIIGSNNGICIIRNDQISCFKRNNYTEEREHLNQVFSDITCSGANSTSSIDCYATDYQCSAKSYGWIACYDRTDSSGCVLAQSGNIRCY